MSSPEMPVAPGRVVMLFTESYPFDMAHEATFIEPELLRLRDAFDRVIVIPSRTFGQRAAMPNGIETDLGLAGYLAARSAPRSLLMRAILSSLMWRDLLRRPAWRGWPKAIRRLVGTAARAEFTREWVKLYLAEERLPTARCVAYTYWCTQVTTGLSLLKQECSDLVVVSRAHNHDLYPERHNPAYLPCRTQTLRYLDRLYPDSEQGVHYVAEHYPDFAQRCEVARMGVDDPHFAAARSPAGEFVLVSCSFVIPVKRVDLILRAVDHAARLRPSVRIEWHHIGDGPLKAEFEERAQSTLPPSAVAKFHGQLAPVELMRFYRSRPVDAFVNASLMEGTPVSIMEAISCGIPVVATDVGGNSEIVSEQNGYLVGANPSPEEMADAFLLLIDRPDLAAERARASVDVWRSRYHAGQNYTSFARRLADLRSVA